MQTDNDNIYMVNIKEFEKQLECYVDPYEIDGALFALKNAAYLIIIKEPVVIKADTPNKLIEDIKKYKEDSDNVQYFISCIL